MAVGICQFFILLILSLSIILVSAKKDLKLLHVLSVNKFYVPDFEYTALKFEPPKNLTYEYFIRNAVEMPNSVKMDLYKLGSQLRRDYDLFLGPLYIPGIIKMQTTEFPISIVAGELINAGLWPPFGPQVWNEDLAWQPVPFEYTPADEDTLLLGTLCPRFKDETFKVLENHHNNLSSTQKELLSYLNKTAQINVMSLLQIPSLYFALENSVLLNQTLPAWTNKIFSGNDLLLNATLAAYDLLSQSKVQRLFNGGSLLKTVLKDSKDYIGGQLDNDRKINIYSSDDRLFAGVMKNLNIKLYNVPNSAAALIFELYEEGKNHFIKTVYYTGDANNDTLPIALPGCDLFCSIDNFLTFLADIMHLNEKDLCHVASPIDDPSVTEIYTTQNIIKTTEKTSSKKSSSMALSISNTLIVLASFIITYTTSKLSEN